MKNRARLIRPTYFEYVRILHRLENFKNLVLYFCPFAGYASRASKPITTYVSENLRSDEKSDILEEQISKLVHLAAKDLRYAGVPTLRAYDTHRVEENDVFLNIFVFLRTGWGNASRYDALIDIINRGIGYYEVRKKKEGRKLFNPIYWVSYIIKIPVLIIQGADLVADDEAGKVFFKIYAWAIRILMFMILLLIARKLGVELFSIKH